MANSVGNFDSALKDLIVAFASLDEDLSSKFGGDRSEYTSALTETLETSLESAVDDSGLETSVIARMVNAFFKAIESLDPEAFDEIEEEINLDYSPEEGYEDEAPEE